MYNLERNLATLIKCPQYRPCPSKFLTISEHSGNIFIGVFLVKSGILGSTPETYEKKGQFAKILF